MSSAQRKGIAHGSLQMVIDRYIITHIAIGVAKDLSKRNIKGVS